MSESSNFVWDQHRELTADEQERLDARRKKSGASQALGAAMIAVGDIIDPSKSHMAVVAEVGDDREDDLPFGLDFGKLPPLA